MASAAAMVVDDNFEDDQLASMTTEDIIRASRLLDTEIRVLKEELQRTNLELDSFKEKIKENQEKIKLNKQLPYLVGNIVEILEMNPEEEAEEDGANIDLDSQRKGKCVVLKTSTRQTIFLPVVGLVDADQLKPGDLVGVNKDSYLILDTLPSEYDSRVKAMEVDEKPTELVGIIGRSRIRPCGGIHRSVTGCQNMSPSIGCAIGGGRGRSVLPSWYLRRPLQDITAIYRLLLVVARRSGIL